MKLKNSLLSKYMLIILLALILLPFSFPLILIVLNMLPIQITEKDATRSYKSGIELEQQWLAEAKKLGGATDAQIDERLMELGKVYSESSLFWVDEEGTTRLQFNSRGSIPAVWSVADIIHFMKISYDNDPFTVVAFIGEAQSEGFMVLQMNRAHLGAESNRVTSQMNAIIVIGTLVILVAFLFISWIFFYRIRKRLLRLQGAMTSPDQSGIPASIQVVNQDEIGRLEQAFNHMIEQLEISKQREQEEELLRRELIANLSHDLRTPLTTIRGHAYSLRHEQLSDKGKASIDLIDRKVGYLGQLIENLLSFTLLSSGKYPLHLQHVDINRLVRTIYANWYPVFEKESFNIVSDLPELSVYGDVDPQWFERVLDNLFQNIVNHAHSGGFVSVRIHLTDGGTELEIADRGPGLQGESTGKGAGIGLSIVSLMLREMKLKWEFQSDETGTRIRIYF
jgi:signal transduction histidine kinase